MGLPIAVSVADRLAGKQLKAKAIMANASSKPLNTFHIL
jgi:hypothetical protein